MRCNIFDNASRCDADGKGLSVIFSDVSCVSAHRAKRWLRVRPGQRPRLELRVVPPFQKRVRSSRTCERPRIVAVHQQVPTPLAHSHNKQLDLEIGGRLPLSENLQYPLLDILVLRRRSLRTFAQRPAPPFDIAKTGPRQPRRRALSRTVAGGRAWDSGSSEH